MKITCDVIKDLAELYVGDMLSEDSKMVVEEHVKNCINCREYIDKLKEAFGTTAVMDYEKIAEEKANFQTLKDRVVAKVVPVMVLTLVAVFTALMTINYALFEHEIVMPYDGETVYVTEDGFLHFPECYNVSFTGASSGNIRVQVYTNYISELRGIESSEEEIVDIKELITDQGMKMYYKDGMEEKLIWG